MADDEAMETTTHTPVTTDRLERPVQGRVVAGVAAGIAQRAGWSVGLVRIGFLIAALFGGFGVLLYLAAWALMPETGETESPSERWLANLDNPDRRTSAIVIGVIGAIVIISLAPISALAVVALIVGAAILASERRKPQAPTEAGNEEVIDDSGLVTATPHEDA